ncbi:MAG: hypothetical protein U0792_06350 [Gemmataceae bacterium]
MQAKSRSSLVAGRASAKQPRRLFLQEEAKVVIAGRVRPNSRPVAAELKASDSLRTQPTDVTR